MSDQSEKLIRRRTAMARLGLSALAVYAAPTIVHLDRSANAQVRPSCNGKSKGNPWCNTGKGKSKGKGNSKGKGKRRRTSRNNQNNRNNRNNRR